MILGLIKYHILTLAREPINMFFGLGLPFLYLFIMSNQLIGNPMMVDGALGVFITVTTMVLCLTDSANSHAYTRQIKFLRRLRMTSVKPWHYIITGILSRISVLFLFIVAFIATLVFVFDMSLADRNWLLFSIVVALAFSMFYLIGMFIANMLRNAKMSQSSTLVVFFVLLLGGGFMFPLDNAPDIMQTISNGLPPEFAITTLRNVWMGMDIFYGHYFVAMIVATIAFGVLSVVFFKYE